MQTERYQKIIRRCSVCGVSASASGRYNYLCIYWSSTAIFPGETRFSGSPVTHGGERLNIITCRAGRKVSLCYWVGSIRYNGYLCIYLLVCSSPATLSFVVSIVVLIDSAFALDSTSNFDSGSSGDSDSHN